MNLVLFVWPYEPVIKMCVIISCTHNVHIPQLISSLESAQSGIPSHRAALGRQSLQASSLLSPQLSLPLQTDEESMHLLLAQWKVLYQQKSAKKRA